jgi:chromosome segregation ATPase
MSEEKTRNLDDGRSFEERVFARFDALDSRLGSMETRFEKVESRLGNVESELTDVKLGLEKLEREAEKRAIETKPMWEKALAEIFEVKEMVGDVGRKLDHLTLDVPKVRADMTRVGRRVDNLESTPSS